MIDILKSIGHIEKGCDMDALLPLLNDSNDKIRMLTVKNIGKACNIKYLETFFTIAQKDRSNIVRCAAVSSIGRLKDSKSIPYLFKLLEDEDPKIVAQAIRGLLVFKANIEVENKLKPFINSENDIIKTLIMKEYYSDNDSDIVSKSKRKMQNFTYDYLKNLAINADTIEVMKRIDKESVHLTFTSPPYYNARDYSIYPSYNSYLEFLSKVFSEVFRITHEGRFLVVNTSPVIIARIGRKYASHRYPIPFDLHGILTRIGWEFIDDIVWEKPEYSVKNRIGGFMQHRKPLAYKPNSVTEYLMVYRKKSDKLLDWNIRQYDKETVESSKVQGEFERTNIWKISPKSDKTHSAVFPSALCERVIKYYSYKGDLIFDPFSGSGTVGIVAKRLGRYFLLTEKDKVYFDYMKRRILLENAEIIKEESIFSKENKKRIEVKDKFLSLTEAEKWIEEGRRWYENK